MIDMDKVTGLWVILASLILVFGFGFYHVQIKGLALRRTANLDIDLLGQGKYLRVQLANSLSGFIMIESAFASVTAGILFVFLALFATGTIRLGGIDATIACAVAFSLSLATVSWVLSLEELSHMISPSLSNRVFCNLYKESFNLWNLGLMLLIFSVCCVLILVDPIVAIAVTILTSFLVMRTLYMVHGWDDNKPVRPSVGSRIRSSIRSLLRMKKRETANRSSRGTGVPLGLSLLLILLFPLYGPLNIPRVPLHNLETSFDRWLPFWPIFALPYLSYFLYLALSIFLLIWRRQIAALNRLLLALCLSLATAYIIYGFFQTVVTRPVVSPDSSWLSWLVSRIYSQDNPFNDFPSLHTALSISCALALWGPDWKRRAWAGWAGAIVLSTLFIKQHYIADVLSGTGLALVTTWISRRAFSESS